MYYTTLLSIVFVAIVTVYGRPNDYDVDSRGVAATISNRLGDSLLNRLEENENLFYSPTSISVALSALYVGTRGVTRQELGTIGYRQLEDQGYSVPRSYQQLLESLQSNSDEYKLEVANALITQANYPILEEYKNTLRSSYNALSKEVDFLQDKDGAVEEINNWVNEKTHGKITQLVDDLDESTRLLLLNAVYFKGTWKTEFDRKNTRQRPFYNNGEEASKLVPTMNVKSKYPFLYHKQKNLKAIKLPYKGEDISMVILLPVERDGVSRVQNEVSNDDLYEIIDSLVETEVTVHLPRFKFDYSRSLKRHLESMGARSLFRSNADLSGITGSNELYVSDVLHKAVIEVNEEGSEAAAVTAVIIQNKMAILPEEDHVFNANHPFLFYIIDERTKTNLFVGRLNKL